MFLNNCKQHISKIYILSAKEIIMRHKEYIFKTKILKISFNRTFIPSIFAIVVILQRFNTLFISRDQRIIFSVEMHKLDATF